MADFFLGLPLAGPGVSGEYPRMLIVVDDISCKESHGLQQIHSATHGCSLEVFRVEQAVVETVI